MSDSYISHDIAFGGMNGVFKNLLPHEDYDKIQKPSRPPVFHAPNTGAGVPKNGNDFQDESIAIKEEYMKIIKYGLGKTGAQKKKVVIIGAGTSGLCAGRELKRAGFDIEILEASSRIGGRVITFRDPHFAPGLHGEGAAMRIPKDHFLLHAYISKFKLDSQLFPFEMKNKFIRLEGLGKTMTYDEFNQMLKDKDPKILALFPGLKEEEKGKTPDDMYNDAVQPVTDELKKTYDAAIKAGDTVATAVIKAYKAVTTRYDKYTLRTFFTDEAKWSEAAVNLYDLGNAHVVLQNGFIESWKDGFLSSNLDKDDGMMQLQGGMDMITNAFITPNPDDKEDPKSLIGNINYGARATEIIKTPGKEHAGKVKCKRPSGIEFEVDYDYLIVSIPFSSLRLMAKSNTFSPMKEAAIRQVRYVEVTKVLLQYQKRWWEDIFKKHDQGKDGGLVTDLPIRYTMFPKTAGSDQAKNSQRGVVMAAYTFEQDATALGCLTEPHRISLAAENLQMCFPDVKSKDLLEAGASMVWPADEMAGGSAFCYFGPGQKSQFLEEMCKSEWDDTVWIAGEHASYTHGWIQGAFEAGLRCAKEIFTKAK